MSYLALPFILPPMLLAGLGKWSIVPVVWSALVLALAWHKKWVWFGFILVTSMVALFVGFGAIDMNEMSGPATFGAAFALGGAFFWILDTAVIAAIMHYARGRGRQHRAEQ